MNNKTPPIAETTLKGFLQLIKNDKNIDKVFENLDYEVLWNYVDKEENVLKEHKILKVEEKHINSKKTILKVEEFKKLLSNYLMKRKYLSIQKFIKTSELIDCSYSTIYNLILENEEALKKEKVITVDISRGKRNIKITNPEKMESFINENN